MLVLLGVEKGDGEAQAGLAGGKDRVNLRIFEDQAGKMNLSLRRYRRHVC
jgi:D-Tyr-tRNAtyr deacylase